MTVRENTEQHEGVLDCNLKVYEDKTNALLFDDIIRNIYGNPVAIRIVKEPMRVVEGNDHFEIVVEK